MEVMCQPNDASFYRKLDDDPTEDFSNEIASFLQEAFNRHVIDLETLKYLLLNNAKASQFYILLKIHKPGNPGRPIVSSCGSPTEVISHFVYYHLRPWVEQVPSYIKDTTDLLGKLQDLTNSSPDVILVTLDVKSLYTNIPQTEGIEACKSALGGRDVLQPLTED